VGLLPPPPRRGAGAGGEAVRPSDSLK